MALIIHASTPPLIHSSTHPLSNADVTHGDATPFAVKGANAPWHPASLVIAYPLHTKDPTHPLIHSSTHPSSPFGHTSLMGQGICCDRIPSPCEGSYSSYSSYSSTHPLIHSCTSLSPTTPISSAGGQRRGGQRQCATRRRGGQRRGKLGASPPPPVAPFPPTHAHTHAHTRTSETVALIEGRESERAPPRHCRRRACRWRGLPCIGPTTCRQRSRSSKCQPVARCAPVPPTVSEHPHTHGTASPRHESTHQAIMCMVAWRLHAKGCRVIRACDTGSTNDLTHSSSTGRLEHHPQPNSTCWSLLPPFCCPWRMYRSVPRSRARAVKRETMARAVKRKTMA